MQFPNTGDHLGRERSDGKKTSKIERLLENMMQQVNLASKIGMRYSQENEFEFDCLITFLLISRLTGNVEVVALFPFSFDLVSSFVCNPSLLLRGIVDRYQKPDKFEISRQSNDTYFLLLANW